MHSLAEPWREFQAPFHEGLTLGLYERERNKDPKKGDRPMTFVAFARGQTQSSFHFSMNVVKPIALKDLSNRRPP
jgi:hypothetical protein